MVPGVKDTEYVSLEESTRVLQPATKHQPAVEEPDYDLTISKTVTDHILRPLLLLPACRFLRLADKQCRPAGPLRFASARNLKLRQVSLNRGLR